MMEGAKSMLMVIWYVLGFSCPRSASEYEFTALTVIQDNARCDCERSISPTTMYDPEQS